MEIKNSIQKVELLDIDQLTPLQGELKKLTDENFNKLRQSLIDRGFQFTVHVWEQAGITYIIDGHQRVHVMKQLRAAGWDVPKINCAFVTAKTYHEAKELILYSISQYGKIDHKGFEEFTMNENFDYLKFDLPDFKIDLPELDNESESESDDNVYTSKIESPVYEPKGDKPLLSDLYQDDKYKNLLKEIDESSLDKDVKSFLRIAAARHIVFNYEKIAEYYAHASKELQDLMEKSALVIIDFNKAIEEGFVELTNEIADIVNSQVGDSDD